MENEKSLVKSSEVKLPKFVEQAYDSIEGMKQFANMLLESKLVPDSYYEKGPDNKPDYTKGKTSAVVIVLLQAQQLAVPPMTGLQHIVPVNGLLSIKGDLAKTMIFASGKLKKDSWKEVVTGSIEEENMVVSLTATREDNGVTLTRTFSVDKAKRMGLWVTKQMVEGQDGWKHKKSAWFKTPDRMLQYRALGNLARDLFSDVLLNMYTTEEAVDINIDTTEIIETDGGAKIIIPDKEHAKVRSTKMTDRVAERIPDNKFGEVKKDGIQEAVIIPEKEQEVKEDKGIQEESPFKAEKDSAEYMNGVKIIRNDQGEIANMDEVNAGKQEAQPIQPDSLEATDTKILLKQVMDDMDMMEAAEIMPGKNTKNKLIKIITAHQEGKLAELVAPFMNKSEEGNASMPPEEVKAGDIPINKDFEKQGPAKTQEQIDKEADDFLDPKKEIKKPIEAGNKYGLIIPEYDKGEQREFSTTKNLFNKMMGIEPQITTPRYMDLSAKLNLLEKYPDKEKFCRDATVAEINLLLSSN